MEYIEECRRLTLADGGKGIKVLPPDVNISDKDFTPVYVEKASDGATKRRGDGGKKKGAGQIVEGVIRFGMMAVRGVGEKAVEAVILQRSEKGPFSSLFDFCERVDVRQVSRSTIEALVKCGAFSSVSPKRAALLQVVDKAVEMGQQAQNDKQNGQLNMFAGPAAATAPSAASMMGAALPDVEEFKNAELLKFEKELLGFYITSHPLTDPSAHCRAWSWSCRIARFRCSRGSCRRLRWMKALAG